MRRDRPAARADDPNAPYMPWKWEDHIPATAAINAVGQGTATPEQQIMAFDAIINGICRYYDLSYRPDSERDTAFAEGKRFVGATLVKITKIDVNAINKAKRGGVNVGSSTG